MGGLINISVQEEPISPMSYDGYSVGQATICNSAASQRNVKFNDILGDFVVGKNYSHAQGLPAQTLRIINFTDDNFFIENSSGNQSPAPGFVPRRLKNLTTNTVITTFPYEISIANLSQLGVENIGTELICPSDTVNYTGRRVRQLSYRILDSNGAVGPLKIADYMNTPQ
jgi:hypothetical protein